jgi:glycerol kinase
MQFQSDILDTIIQRPKVTETTVMGAVYLAGICVGLWNQEDILAHRKIEKVFNPEKRKRLYSKWKKAIERSKNWID